MADNDILVEDIQSKRKKYQRMLIPANIVVVIIALVAAIFQLVMPMLSVKLTVTGENVTSVVNYIDENSESGDEEMAETLDTVRYIARDVNADISIKLSPKDALLLGPVPAAQSVRDYIAANAAELEGTVDLIFEQMLPRLTVYMVAQAAQDELEEVIGIDQLEEIDTEQVAAVTEAISAGNFEEAREQFSTAADDIAADLGYDLTAEDKETIMQYYDEAIEAGRQEDGTFSYTKAIQTIADKYGIDLGAITGEDGENTDGTAVDLDEIIARLEAVETAEDLEEIIDMLRGQEGMESLVEQLERVEDLDEIAGIIVSLRSGNAGDMQSPASLRLRVATVGVMSDMQEDITQADPNELLGGFINEIPDSTATIIGTILFAVAAVMIGLTSVLWIILAILAFIKIFCKNKRFTMWYVKAFCWLPCILLVLVPTLAVSLTGLVGGLLPASAAQAYSLVTSLGLSFGGSGIVSGICLALLWIVSIFWLFPIKRKIRKLN